MSAAPFNLNQRVFHTDGRAGYVIGFRSADIAITMWDGSTESTFTNVLNLRHEAVSNVVEMPKSVAPVADKYSAVPGEMKELPRWITWSGDAKSKEPYQSGTHTPASTTNPDHLVSFDQAIKNVQEGRGYPHLGFVPQPPYIGLDIDSCRNPETGEIQPWLNRFFHLLGPTYIEVTPSQSGLRAWVKAPFIDKKDVLRLRPEFKSVESKEAQIEPLARNYGTITGQRYKDAPSIVAEITEQQWGEIKKYVETLGPSKTPPAPTTGATLLGDRVPRGNHDNYLCSLAARLRVAGLEEEALYNALVETVEKRFDDYGSDYLDMCRKHARTACKKFTPEGFIFIGGRPAGEQPEQVLMDAMLGVNPNLHDAEVKHLVQQVKSYSVEVVERESEPELQTPTFDFLPESAMASTRLGDIYANVFLPNDWPLEFALPALVTAAGAITPSQPKTEDAVVVGDDVMTNFYTALIGGVHVGKSQVAEWAEKAVGIYDASGIGLNYWQSKFGSAEQMIKSLCKRQDKFRNSVLLDIDEWSYLFSKAAIPDASFMSVLTTTFYRRNQWFTLGGGKEFNLRLAVSFIAGIVEEDFDAVFGSRTLGGMYDRFLFGRAPEGFKWSYRPCPIKSESQHTSWNMRPVFQDGSVFEVTKHWEQSKYPQIGRIAELCNRVAVTFASADGRSTITGKDIEALEPLAQYQMGLRQWFKPNAGDNPDATFANKAVDWINQHARGWTPIWQLKRALHRMEEKLGPSVAERALHSLARGGRIDLWLDNGTGKSNLPSDYDGRRVKTGLVRKVK